jgi:hypothetical protein
VPDSRPPKFDLPSNLIGGYFALGMTVGLFSATNVFAERRHKTLFKQPKFVFCGDQAFPLMVIP